MQRLGGQSVNKERGRHKAKNTLTRLVAKRRRGARRKGQNAGAVGEIGILTVRLGAVRGRGESQQRFCGVLSGIYPARPPASTWSVTAAVSTPSHPAVPYMNLLLTAHPPHALALAIGPDDKRDGPTLQHPPHRPICAPWQRPGRSHSA
jgi:hypothetical protein